MVRPVCILFMTSLVLACAGRADPGETASASTYTVEISNQKRTAVLISFSDNGAERTLGSLGVGQSQRFTLNSIEDMITVKARAEGGRLVFAGDVRLVNGRTAFLVVR